MQVIHVSGPETAAEARRVAQLADALLLDSGDPSLPVKELGGTGRTHDWDVSGEIAATVPVPVWLAGGLNASNAATAISRVDPYGVDLCSGVRTADRLDEMKLETFMKAARVRCQPTG